MKIIQNPEWSKEEHSLFAQKIKEGNGYCPCSLLQNEDTKCPCKTFREQTTEGECHCGRYIKIDVKKSVATY